MSLKKRTLLLAFAACAAASPVQGQEVAAPTPAATQYLYDAGVVSAADPRAAEAGAEMLRAGGSATDAAIATMLALNVVEPQSSGIGGGGFFVRGDARGTVTTIDGREKAPAAATPAWFMGADGQPLPFGTAVATGLSVGVPGNIRLAAEAHARHGRLPWAKLFEPAIRLARDGFKVTPRLRESLARMRDRAASSREGWGLYYDAAGQPLADGTVIYNPTLANTLETIARKGVDAFYKGANGAALTAVVTALTPGPAGMTPADLAGYTAPERAPVCGTYRQYRICGMGPPSSGATTVFAILKQLERFDLGAMGWKSPKFWHLFAESQRLAYADRELYLADSDFVTVPIPGLVDEAYLAGRGTLISPDRTMPQAQAGTPPQSGTTPLSRADGDEPEESGTSHFAVVDRQGNAVSYTSTIEGPFGSGIIVGGYYLNNELTDFSFSPEKDGRPVANRVEGSKRPRSSMAPTVVYGPDGSFRLAVGAAGGQTIPVQVARVLIGVIDFDLPAAEAIALPSLYSPGETVFVEKGSSLEEMIPALEKLGHTKVTASALPLKSNAVELVEGRLVGAADPRSEGTAVTQ